MRNSEQPFNTYTERKKPNTGMEAEQEQLIMQT